MSANKRAHLLVNQFEWNLLLRVQCNRMPLFPQDVRDGRDSNSSHNDSQANDNWLLMGENKKHIWSHI